jgi:hypothetical protein
MISINYNRYFMLYGRAQYRVASISSATPFRIDNNSRKVVEPVETSIPEKSKIQ